MKIKEIKVCEDIVELKDLAQLHRNKLGIINNRIDALAEMEREQRRNDRERNQWLNEFTARQAHYHSR